jgi:hypothetical protein
VWKRRTNSTTAVFFASIPGRSAGIAATRAIDRSNVASLRGESSNQLFETLEEWNDYLERYSAPPTGVATLSARRCRVSTGFPVSFGLYLDEPRRQAGG